MRIEKIAFYNFRNIDNCSVSIGKSNTFLVGKNGQGKTNFLEALYVLSYASSFRTKNYRLLCKQGTSEFSVSGTLVDENDAHHSLRVVWQENKKQVIYDEVPIKDRQELLYIFPSVIFSYQDIQIISGSQDAKRLYFNQILSYYDSNYVKTLRSYKKILMARNHSLKNHEITLVNLYDEQLAQYGSEIIAARKKIIKRCNNFFDDVLRATNDLSVTIEYHSAWDSSLDEQGIVQYIRSKRQIELMTGVTKTGPHCDKIAFKINGYDVNAVASTGQFRYISLLLKIFQCSIITERTKNKPVLLLDDVLLELDNSRKQEIIAMLPESEQLFFTVIDQNEISNLYSNYQKLNIEDGSIFENNQN